MIREILKFKDGSDLDLQNWIAIKGLDGYSCYTESREGSWSFKHYRGYVTFETGERICTYEYREHSDGKICKWFHNFNGQCIDYSECGGLNDKRFS